MSATIAPGLVHDAAPVPAPRPARSLRLGRARRFVVPLLLVLLWQAAAQMGLISTRLLAPPSAILSAAWTLVASGELGHHLLVSLSRVGAGLAIALTLGTGLGLVAGLSRIGEATKIALVALGATFPIYLTLFGGIRGTDPKLLEAGRVFGLSHAQQIVHVVLPAALPQALVGLRYALGTAWLSLVVGEQINATAGIGFLVMDAREFLRTDIIVVGLLVYALLGLGADQLVRILERRALAWRPTLVREA